jgi:MFS family permease
LAATALSRLGSQQTLVALPWFVLGTTGSASQTGLAGSFSVLPALLVGVLGGALVDRIGHKRVSVGADIVSGVGVGLVPLLYATVGLAFWQLLGLVLLGSLLALPGLTARRSLLPELAGLGGLRLESVNALFEGIQYLAQLLGPALAGVLILWLGAANVLWLDAASFAVSAVLVASVVPNFRGPSSSAGGHYLHEVAAGLRFLRGDRLRLTLAATLAVTNLLGAPLIAVLLPVYTEKTSGNPADLGLMIAAFGAGSLGGAAIYAVLGHRLPRRTTWVVAFLVQPLVYWVLALGVSTTEIAGVLALGGLIGGGLNPMLVTIRHQRIPAEMRGRVFSTFSAIASGAQPLGMALGGASVDRIGFVETVLVLAVLSQLVGVGLVFVPILRELDRQRTSV